MMNIDYSESDEDGDSKDLMEHSGQDAAAGALQPMDDDEVTAELRRREAEDEEIQRHLHQDEEEDANLNAMLNDNAAEVGAGGDAGAPIQNGTANDNDDEDRERDFLNGNDNGDAQNGDDGDYDEMESEEDEEDDIQITIGDFSKPSLTGAGASAINSLSMNKGGRQFIIGASNAAGGSKSKSSLDLDAVGQYKDVPIFDLNFDTLEDKPWRKPGADITDYFNYGFNEDSWKVYCDRQKKIRSLNASNVFDVNSVINLSSMPVKTLVDGQMVMTAPLHPMDKPMPLSSVNENSKYHSSGSIVISTMMGKRSGPPPGRKTSGAIDVIGGTGTTTMLMNNMNAPMLTPRDETPPPMHTREGLIPTPNMTKENNNQSNFISVIGQRGGPPGPPGLYPPPPLNMPPPFFAPDGFPPMRPPPGMSILGPPPMGPNGQPVMGYGRPGDFPPMNQPRFPPHGGILPHPDLSQQIPFEEDYLHDSVPSRPRAPSSRMSPSRDRHHERERHSRDRESSYSSSRRGGGGGSSYRDHDDSGRSETRGEGSRTGGSSRRDHYREREYRDGGDRGDRGGERRERSRERSQEQPRGGGRSSREKDYESPSVRPTEQPSQHQHQQSSSTISPIVSSAPAPTTSSSKEPAPKDTRDTQSSRSRHRDRSDRKSREKEESSSRSERKDNTKDKDTSRSEKESRSDRGDRGDRDKDKEKDKSDSHHHRSSKDSKAEAKESKSSSSKKGGHDDHSDRKHNTSSSSSSRHHDKSSSSKGGGGGSSSKLKPSKSSSSRRSKDKDRSRKDSD